MALGEMLSIDRLAETINFHFSITAQRLVGNKVLCPKILSRPLRKTNGKNYPLVIFFQPGNAVRQGAGIV